MGKEKLIVHFLILFLTIVIMFFISRIIASNSEFIMQHKEVLPYVMIIIWVLAGLSVYLLYRKEKRGQVNVMKTKNDITDEMKAKIDEALKENRSQFDDAFDSLKEISKKHNLK